MVGFWLYPQTLDHAVNACQGQTLYLIMNTLNYGRKKFYTIGLWDDIHQTSCKPFIMRYHLVLSCNSFICNSFVNSTLLLIFLAFN